MNNKNFDRDVGTDEKNIPEYTSNPVYIELASICEAAGFEIVYERLDDRIEGKTDQYINIFMPDGRIDTFDTDDKPVKTLGHELGHCILERISKGFIETDIEKQCDKIGEYFYILAEMIAMHKAEQILISEEGRVN